MSELWFGSSPSDQGPLVLAPQSLESTGDTDLPEMWHPVHDGH